MGEPEALGFGDLPHGLQVACFRNLSPHTLAVAAAVCRGWRELSSSQEQPWQRHYCELWGAAAGDIGGALVSPTAWQQRYSERQLLSRCWLGRPAVDKLGGQGTAVKACCLLTHRGLLFTGGVDQLVRAWDLLSGIQLACSRRHGGWVRCLAADDSMLVSGSSDHRIRVWRRHRSGNSGGSSGSGGSAAGLPHLFELAGEREVLTGHAGPVSSLQLTAEVLVSGSWDCTIRVWDRHTLQCIQMLHTDDWVTSLALQGSLLAAACGKEILLHRLSDGCLAAAAKFTCPSLANGGSSSGGGSGKEGEATASSAAVITAVACSQVGDAVFAGTADGGVWVAGVAGSHAASASSGRQQTSLAASGGQLQQQQEAVQVARPRPVLLQQAGAEVAGLSWHHPWLAVADRAGSVLLLQAEAATAAGQASVEGSSSSSRVAAGSVGSSSSKRTNAGAGAKQRQQPLVQQVRVLHSGSMGGGSGAQCVALGSCWAAAGMDCGTVVTWDGYKGLQQQAAAAAARQQKAEKRQKNQERQRRQQQRQNPPPSTIRGGVNGMSSAASPSSGKGSRGGTVAAAAGATVDAASGPPPVPPHPVGSSSAMGGGTAAGVSSSSSSSSSRACSRPVDVPHRPPLHPALCGSIGSSATASTLARLQGPGGSTADTSEGPLPQYSRFPNGTAELLQYSRSPSGAGAAERLGRSPGRMRVPPPPRPEAVAAATAAAAASCRQQAWQVLRAARGSMPGAAGGGAVGPAAGCASPSP